MNGLALCLAASLHRPDNLVPRIRSEEFAVLLPDTDERGAMRVVQAVH